MRCLRGRDLFALHHATAGGAEERRDAVVSHEHLERIHREEPLPSRAHAALERLGGRHTSRRDGAPAARLHEAEQERDHVALRLREDLLLGQRPEDLGVVRSLGVARALFPELEQLAGLERLDRPLDQVAERVLHGAARRALDDARRTAETLRESKVDDRRDARIDREVAGLDLEHAVGAREVRDEVVALGRSIRERRDVNRQVLVAALGVERQAELAPHPAVALHRHLVELLEAAQCRDLLVGVALAAAERHELEMPSVAAPLHRRS